MKRHKVQRRIVRNPRPRRPKTFADVSTLEGKEYLQIESGVTLRLEDTAYDQMITMGELLARFYRINEGQPPLVIRLIDEPNGLMRGEKVWQIVMRGNFYIYIEANKESHGPHPTKLWFQSFGDKKNYWLGSMQVMAFFFNEQEIRQAIMTGVDTKEFFMLPQNKDIPIRDK